MAQAQRHIIINGKDQDIEAQPEMRLIDLIRGTLRLTGTKEGCGEGECGACTVLLNDEVVNSCLILFGQLADGDRLLTVEGLSTAGILHPLQQAFIDCGAVQCGMCTPGILLVAHALLMKNPNPTRDEIARAIAGNLCRCTGYKKIIDAVEKAAVVMCGEGR